MIGKDFVIKLSREGRDARSDDLNDFTFHSEVPTLKTDISVKPKHNGIIPYTFTTEPGAGTHVLYKVKHGYNYTPGIMGFIGDPTYIFEFGQTEVSFLRTPFVRSLDFGTGSISRYRIDADGKYLYLVLERTGTAWNTAKGTTIYMKYNILDIKGMQ